MISAKYGDGWKFGGRWMGDGWELGGTWAGDAWRIGRRTRLSTRDAFEMGQGMCDVLLGMDVVV